MAARNTIDTTGNMNRGDVILTGSCVGAATSNPTSVKGNGIASITRSSSGKYVITLSDKWKAIRDWSFNVIDSTAARHYEITVSAEDVATNKTITIEVFGAATTVAPARSDLATTDTLKFRLMLSNSSNIPAGV